MAGTGSVSYVAKLKGREVTYNDVLRSNYYIGLALIENSNHKLSKSEVKNLLSRRSDDYFILETYRGIYYTDKENMVIEDLVNSIKALSNPYKKALAMASLFQACLVKRPFNLFHRSNLTLRLRNVKRGFGNHYVWRKPIELLFARYVNEYNLKVFDNGKQNIAINYDVTKIPHEDSYDLVYIDPPYVSKRGTYVDYYGYYHFLEGLCIYLEHGPGEWLSMIDFSKKNRPLYHVKLWPNKTSELKREFDYLFEKFSSSNIALTYRSDGDPPPSQIVNILKKHKRKVITFKIRYKYALSSRYVHEVLIIGSGS